MVVNAMVTVLPGDGQTVNRGELHTIVELLKGVLPADGLTTEVRSDSAYCVDKAGHISSGDVAIGWDDDIWQHCWHS